MQNFNMLPFVGIYLFYIFSMVHTSDLDQNNYVLETKSGIVDPDDVISTAVVKRKFQCAFMCSRLEECLVYTVRLQAGSNAYTCQFVKDRVWTLNSFSGVTVYRHRHRGKNIILKSFTMIFWWSWTTSRLPIIYGRLYMDSWFIYRIVLFKKKSFIYFDNWLLHSVLNNLDFLTLK